MSERQGIPNRQTALDELLRRHGAPAEEPLPDLMEMLCLFAECLENVMERVERLEARERGR